MLAAQANANVGTEPAPANAQSNRTTAIQNHTIHEHTTTPAQTPTAPPMEVVAASPTSMTMATANAAANRVIIDHSNRPIVVGGARPQCGCAALAQSNDLVAISSHPPPSQSINSSHSINHNNSDNSHLAVDNIRSCSSTCCNKCCKWVKCMLSSIDADGKLKLCDCGQIHKTINEVSVQARPPPPTTTGTAQTSESTEIAETTTTLTTTTTTDLTPTKNDVFNSLFDCTNNTSNNSSHHTSK